MGKSRVIIRSKKGKKKRNTSAGGVEMQGGRGSRRAERYRHKRIESRTLGGATRRYYMTRTADWKHRKGKKIRSEKSAS